MSFLKLNFAIELNELDLLSPKIKFLVFNKLNALIIVSTPLPLTKLPTVKILICLLIFVLALIFLNLIKDGGFILITLVLVILSISFLALLELEIILSAYLYKNLN